MFAIGMVGTTAERVVRRSERPVLVVKRPATEPYRRVLVGIDFSPASRQALDVARRIAPAAELTVVHVYDDWFEAPMRRAGADEPELAQAHREITVSLHQELDDFLGQALPFPEPRRKICAGYPGVALARIADEVNADLVALGTSAHGRVLYALLGSTAEHVIPGGRLRCVDGARHVTPTRAALNMMF